MALSVQVIEYVKAQLNTSIPPSIPPIVRSGIGRYLELLYSLDCSI
jgi:hypothetical protein